MLNLRDISKHFGNLKAVSNVTFNLKEGEIVGLIGPNGAGKTTLISLIDGSLNPTGGSITFLGEDIAGKRPDELARKGMARTFQIVRVFKEMTVYENILVGALFAGNLGLSQAKQKVKEALDFTGMAHLKDKTVREITLPDQKKLQIARALATDPKLLLLDEAMAGLNSKEVEAAIELVGRIRAQGISILVIEHLMKVIMNISDRIIVLHHGELIAEGTPREITSNEAVIAAYFGERYKKHLDQIHSLEEQVIG